jgi:hypothetical protein
LRVEFAHQAVQGESHHGAGGDVEPAGKRFSADPAQVLVAIPVDVELGGAKRRRW